MLRIMGGERVPESVVLPTPSFGLNHVLGGGFWTGRFHLVWGNPQAGKTTFLLQMMALAQDAGYVPVIVDSEGSYTDEWAEKCGIDLEQRIYLKDNVVENITKELIPIMKSNGKYTILIDSVNAFEFASFYKDDDGAGGLGSGARSRRFLFQKLGQYIDPVNHIALMVSQQTVDIGQQGRIIPKIGKAEEHWATNIVHLFASIAKDNLQRDQNSQKILSKQIQWRINKTKQAPIEGTVGNYWFSPQTALIDQKKEIINIAVENGVVDKRGAWFYLPSGDKFQGFDKLVAGIDDNNWKLIQDALASTDLVFSNAATDE